MINIKYSIIFPTYDPDKILGDFAELNKQKILDTIKDRDDVEFIEVKDVKGFPSAVNKGISQSTGEYIVIVNSDVSIEREDWLEQMTNPNLLTSYTDITCPVTNESYPHFGLICIPRNIYEAVGDFDTQFNDTCGFDDIDYYRRTRNVGFGFRSLKQELGHQFKVTHGGGYTFKGYFTPDERNEMREVGMERLKKKHNL